MHFVDYDYAMVTATEPEVTERMFSFDGLSPVPSRGAVSTSLDRLTFDAGQVIFRPGDRIGQYFVVVEGEVEIRAEGYGADQTVARVGPGQLFGDQGALRGQRGVFTAHAVTRATLLAVEREAIRDLLLPDEHPDWTT
jgi:CRP-like cAMP-binding protein